MNLICMLFGHKVDRHQYLTFHRDGADGLDREHAYLNGTCPRCKTVHTVGNVHLIARDQERRLDNEVHRMDGRLTWMLENFSRPDVQAEWARYVARMGCEGELPHLCAFIDAERSKPFFDHLEQVGRELGLRKEGASC
jgi:hypothetical protein